MVRKTAIMLCIVSLVLSLFASGCTERLSGPEKALKEFETAINERDMDGIIGIFKPSEQAKLKLQLALSKLTASIFGNIVGLGSLGDLFTDELMNAMLGVAMEDSYAEIRVLSEKYNENRTRATVKMEITMGETTEVDTIEMVKISDKWYWDVALFENADSEQD